MELAHRETEIIVIQLYDAENGFEGIFSDKINRNLCNLG